ncbi:MULTISPECIES: ABC transporter permease [unclassified Ornithinimicrobium]|uniref:ABC transporter permease n=1 Tax=unclassified Ornithinimicrobium TaxID=2615080 RepID=UPI003852BB83
MINLVRAELRKATTTRLVWTMPLAMFLLGVAFTAISGYFLVFAELPGMDVRMSEGMSELTLARSVYTGAIQMAYLLALVLGILTVTGEYRHQTLTSTFLAEPRRGRVIVAKLVALVVVVLVNGLAHVAGSFVGGASVLAAGDVAVFPEPADLTWTLLRMLLVLVLWGLMGLGLGVLIPNQVAALFVGVSVAFLVEPLLGFGVASFDRVAEAARYFPSQATLSALSVYEGMDAGTAQDLGGAPDPLSWWGGSLVLLAYAGVMTAIGWVITRRRDVS